MVKRLGYNASKAALNMLTVHLAAELKDAGIKVNSADPGFTATDLNGHRGYQTVQQGATAALRLALLTDDGPTGGFFSGGQAEPW
jgi:NAD(P)-dependent dehydrogenase (short-subunit alcohol dehydrogenase family)